MPSQNPHSIGVLVTALYGSIALAAAVGSTDSFDVLDYVDPLIGTANGGAKTWTFTPTSAANGCLYQAMYSLEQPCLLVSTDITVKLSWSNKYQEWQRLSPIQ